MKKTILPVCAALLLTAGLVSCGNGGNDKPNAKTVALSVWVPQEQKEWAEERIAAFKANYPDTNYNISVSACPEGDVQTQIKNDPTSAADVFFFAGDHLGPLVEGDYLYEFPSTFKDALANEIDERILSSAIVDGALYGIPYTPNSYFLYYNGDKVTAEEAKDLDSILEKGQFVMDVPNGWYQTAFWYGTGVRFFGPDGTDPTEANLNSEEGKLAAKALRDYVVGQPNFVSGDEAKVKSEFTPDSDIVAVIGGSWISETLLATFGQSLKTAVLPTFTAGGQKYNMTATGDYKKCGVAKYTDAPVDALNLAVWLTDSTSMLQKLERFNEAPVLNSLATNELLTSNDVAMTLLAQTNNPDLVVRQPSISQMSNWWNAATEYGNALIEARTAETEFTDAQCEEWAETLQSNLLATI